MLKKNCKMYRKILTLIGAVIVTANCAEVEVNRHFRGDIFSFKGKFLFLKYLVNLYGGANKYKLDPSKQEH